MKVQQAGRQADSFLMGSTVLTAGIQLSCSCDAQGECGAAGSAGSLALVSAAAQCRSPPSYESFGQVECSRQCSGGCLPGRQAAQCSESALGQHGRVRPCCLGKRIDHLHQPQPSAWLMLWQQLGLCCERMPCVPEVFLAVQYLPCTASCGP